MELHLTIWVRSRVGKLSVNVYAFSQTNTIYLWYLQYYFHGILLKFQADDLKLYTTVTSTSHNLQDVLSYLLLWSNDWHLKVNVKTCHVLQLHKNNSHNGLLFWWQSHRTMLLGHCYWYWHWLLALLW